MAGDIDTTDLTTVTRKGWSGRDLLFYVAGSESDGGLKAYGFRLSFEDEGGAVVYSLPMDNQGPLLPRLFRAKDGKFRVQKASTASRDGSLLLKAWPLDPGAGLPDLQARCPYVPVCTGPIMFRVDPVEMQGKVTTTTTHTVTDQSGAVDWASQTSENYSTGLSLGGGPNFSLKPGGGENSVGGTGSMGISGGADAGRQTTRTMKGPTFSSTDTTTTADERPTTWVKTITVRQIGQPPTQ